MAHNSSNESRKDCTLSAGVLLDRGIENEQSSELPGFESRGIEPLLSQSVDQTWIENFATESIDEEGTEAPDGGPVPWPLPPRINSKGEREFLSKELSAKGQSGDVTTQSSAPPRRPGKVSRSVFQKISELYPESLDLVLRSDQIPTPIGAALSEPASHSASARFPFGASTHRSHTNSDSADVPSIDAALESQSVACESSSVTETAAQHLTGDVSGLTSLQNRRSQVHSKTIKANVEQDKEGDSEREQDKEGDSERDEDKEDNMCKELHLDEMNAQEEHITKSLDRRIGTDINQMVLKDSPPGLDEQSNLQNGHKANESLSRSNESSVENPSSSGSSVKTFSSGDSFAEEEDEQPYSFSNDNTQRINREEALKDLFDDEEVVEGPELGAITEIESEAPKQPRGITLREDDNNFDQEQDQTRYNEDDDSRDNAQYDDRVASFPNQQTDAPPAELDTSESFRSMADEEANTKPVLRRPIASRRKSFVDIPGLNRPLSQPDESTSNARIDFDAIEEDDLEITNVDSIPLETEYSNRPRGVVMRTYSRETAIRGSRRAETGIIMSQADLRGGVPQVAPVNPNPKTFRPKVFLEEKSSSSFAADDLPTSSVEEANYNENTQVAEAIQTTNYNETPQAIESKEAEERTSEKENASSIPATDRSTEGHRPYQGYNSSFTHQYTSDVSTTEDPSRLLRRVSSGIRRASDAIKRQSSHDVPETGKTELRIRGTTRQVVHRIARICKHDLNYDVFVKDTGKKIRVKSLETTRQAYLHASIIVTQQYGPTLECIVKVRQSRSDGMMTDFATLWSFYKSLEAELDDGATKNGNSWFHEALFED